jgi:hypothetical protein
MSLAENPEIREWGGYLRNERKSLRDIRARKSVPTEITEKLRPSVMLWATENTERVCHTSRREGVP